MRKILIPYLFVIIAFGWSGNKIWAQEFGWFDRSMDLIREEYFQNIDTFALPQEVLSHLVSAMDPYSDFLPDSLHQQKISLLRASFYSLDLDCVYIRDSLMVLQSGLDDVPAGSWILSIDGQKPDATEDEDLLFYAPDPRACLMEIINHQSGKKQKVSCVRTKKLLHTVSGPFFPGDHTAYFRIKFFSAKTANELANKIRELQSRKVDQLIIDLRANPGGLVETAAECCDLFLPKGRLICKITKRDSVFKQFYSKTDPVFPKGRLLLLTDSLTASAAEVFAAALQDQKRALIFGQRSFGKGLVQLPFSLAPYGYMYLTVGEYIRPSGESIQKTFRTALASFDHGRGGITPDVQFGRPAYFDALEIMKNKALFEECVFDYYKIIPKENPKEADWNAMLALLPELAWGRGILFEINPKLEEIYRMQLKRAFFRLSNSDKEASILEIRNDPQIQEALKVVADEKAYVLRALSY